MLLVGTFEIKSNNGYYIVYCYYYGTETLYICKP